MVSTIGIVLRVFLTTSGNCACRLQHAESSHEVRLLEADGGTVRTMVSTLVLSTIYPCFHSRSSDIFSLLLFAIDRYSLIEVKPEFVVLPY